MPRPAAASYADLIVTVGDPKAPRMLERPRRARVRARTYGGQVVHVELDVVAVATGLMCVRQERSGLSPWNAWVSASAVQPTR